MIPPTIGDECTSPGEKEVFHRLCNDPGTRDWIVLHSLDVANHRKQIAGEIDFVVIIPGKGVLCLEVKAHQVIRRTGGEWYFGSAGVPESRGPFKQVSEAMHSLRDWVSIKRPDLSRLPFWSAVIFPYVEFRIQSDEWHPWQLVDANSFRSRPLPNTLSSILVRARQHLVDHNASWFEDDDRPTMEQCASLAGVLRPNFEFFESPRTRVRSLDAQVRTYTEEQYAALDALQANQRVVFEGPAGTGKTLIAIEAARRAFSVGKRVLFVCFNKMLGHWLARQTDDLRRLVTTSTLHSQMLAVAGLSSHANHVTPHFWDTELPNAAIDRLLGGDGTHSYDEIIVDEAQDVLRPAYVDFLDLSVAGGISAGAWKMFGDFEKQAIYDPTINIQRLLDDRAPSATRYRLRMNCRNTPRIAELVHLLGGLAPKYTSVLRPDDGNNPRLEFYETREQQAELLIKELEHLHREGYSPRDIVILSPLGRSSCASCLPPGAGVRNLKPMAESDTGGLRFCTVHAFKGLEAKAIIVTDVEEIGTQAAMDLFYIGVTRALHSVSILAHNRVRQQARAKLFGDSGRPAQG